MRLVSLDDNDRKGCVQVFHDNTWGSVCNTSFTPMDGAAVCHTLGFSGYMRLTTCSSTIGGSAPVWLDGFNCQQNDRTIDDCQGSSFGMHQCLGHGYDVGVECAGDCLSVCLSIHSYILYGFQ